MNSASASLRDGVLFLDRCLGRKVVAEALRAAGRTVELMEDHFEKDTEDTVWVPEVGKRRWIILTKDKALRNNSLELVALLKSDTHSFILTSADQTGPQMAQAFVTALPQIDALVGKFQPPFVGTVSPAGAVDVFFTHDQLIAAIISRK